MKIKLNAPPASDGAFCSRSLDLFKDWEQYCRVKVTGYTFRRGTDVMRINFGPSGPSPLSKQTMADHVRLEFEITAIHYSENAEVKRGSPDSEN